MKAILRLPSHRRPSQQNRLQGQTPWWGIWRQRDKIYTAFWHLRCCREEDQKARTMYAKSG